MAEIDPLKVNERLYKQVSKLLDDMERPNNELTVRERLAAVIAIGRLQVIFMGLRKEVTDDAGTGSSVRKYSAAFKNAARRGKKGTRSTASRATDAWVSASLGSDDEGDIQ
jgi:hypothetical protein